MKNILNICSFSHKLFLLHVFLLSSFCIARAAIGNGSITAIYTFGDSILDTGSNNDLTTFSKCNFPPYGRDFPGGAATGRFCNGKVPSDLLADALGIKEILPAYLDPNLKDSDLPTGVGFASGGSGSDLQTSKVQGVLSLPDQLDLFKKYVERLKGVSGEEQAKAIINNSLVIISSGNNDVAFTYNAIRRYQYTFPDYVNQLVQWSSDFVKELYEIGVRKIGFFSTLPLGCLPSARTLGGGVLRFCSILTNEEAKFFNSKLSSGLDSLKSELPDSKLVFIDVYTSLLNIIESPGAKGFYVATNGCCGTGTMEMGPSCNQTLFSCQDANSYVFWDAAHPTEHAYKLIVDDIVAKYGSSFA